MSGAKYIWFVYKEYPEGTDGWRFCGGFDSKEAAEAHAKDLMKKYPSEKYYVEGGDGK